MSITLSFLEQCAYNEIAYAHLLLHQHFKSRSLLTFIPFWNKTMATLEQGLQECMLSSVINSVTM